MPQEIVSAKFKVCGVSITMNYDDKLLARCTLDRKYVIPLYTTYNAEPVWTGTLHWQTKEPIEQPMIIHMYSKDYLSTYYIHLDRPVHKD